MFAIAKWLAASLGAKVDIRVVHRIPLGLYPPNTSGNTSRRVTMYECSKDSCVKVFS